MNLQNMCNRYGKKLSNHYAKEKELKDIVEKTTEKLREHGNKYPHWKEGLIEPIAKELSKFFPSRYYQILGPFGLTCEISIHFYKNKAKKAKDNKEFHTMWDSDKNFVKSITFRPNDLENGELVLVNHKKNTNEYKKGTLGEMNGFNYPNLPLPKTFEELRRFVK